MIHFAGHIEWSPVVHDEDYLGHCLGQTFGNAVTGADNCNVRELFELGCFMGSGGVKH